MSPRCNGNLRLQNSARACTTRIHDCTLLIARCGDPAGRSMCPIPAIYQTLRVMQVSKLAGPQRYAPHSSTFGPQPRAGQPTALSSRFAARCVCVCVRACVWW